MLSKMSFLNSQQLFFFLLIVPSLPLITFGLEPVLYHSCSKIFSKNDLLQSNINNLFIDIKKMVSTDGYAISSFGSSYDAVYGVARCQEDLSREECSLCISDAADKIQKACPESANALVWHEYCFLRYDTDNFIGKLDLTYASLWMSRLAANNSEAFKDGVAELMAEVMTSAAGEKRKFSSGENLLKGCEDTTIYGMAQCTQDLEKSTCNQCLEYSFEIMQSCCGNSSGCRIFGSSCALRYEVYKFINNTEIDAPAPAPTARVYY